jgi:hypothetical protein
MSVVGPKSPFDLLPATSGLRLTTDIIRPARWGGFAPISDRTGTNEATTRRNLLTQRFTAVGTLIASGAPCCVAGVSAGL